MTDEQREDRRAGRWITLAFGASTLGALGFAVVYAWGGQTQLEGIALALAFAGLSVGLRIWARHLVQVGGYVEEHHGFASPPQQQDALTEQFASVARPRRRGLVGMLGLAVAAIGVAALFPLRSLLQPQGSTPHQELSRTPWRAGGLRLVDPEGRPVRPEQVTSETIVIVYPEGHIGKGDAPAFLVRLEAERFTERPPGGDVSGVVAYSLLCTHAGCPIGLYEEGTGQLLCPCHQSVFDLLAAARPISGPAGRSLPGLPIEVDAEGYLVATGDFTAPPGPGFWSLP